MTSMDYVFTTDVLLCKTFEYVHLKDLVMSVRMVNRRRLKILDFNNNWFLHLLQNLYDIKANPRPYFITFARECHCNFGNETITFAQRASEDRHGDIVLAYPMAALAFALAVKPTVHHLLILWLTGMYGIAHEHLDTMSFQHAEEGTYGYNWLANEIVLYQQHHDQFSHEQKPMANEVDTILKKRHNTTAAPVVNPFMFGGGPPPVLPPPSNTRTFANEAPGMDVILLMLVTGNYSLPLRIFKIFTFNGDLSTIPPLLTAPYVKYCCFFGDFNLLGTTIRILREHPQHCTYLIDLLDFRRVCNASSIEYMNLIGSFFLEFRFQHMMMCDSVTRSKATRIAMFERIVADDTPDVPTKRPPSVLRTTTHVKQIFQPLYAAYKAKGYQTEIDELNALLIRLYPAYQPPTL